MCLNKLYSYSKDLVTSAFVNEPYNIKFGIIITYTENKYTCAYTDIHMHICAHIYIYMHTHILIFMHIHTYMNLYNKDQ